MTDSEKIKKFFTTPIEGSEFRRIDILNIRRIEIQSKIPLRSLFDFLKGIKYRNIEKHTDKIIKTLRYYGYRY